MKRIIALLLALLVLSLMLCSCDDKEKNKEEDAGLPSLENPDRQDATGDSPNSGSPTPETGGADNQPTNPNGSEDPAQSDPAIDTQSAVIDTEDENGGLEIIDDYTVEIGDDVGVGGN